MLNARQMVWAMGFLSAAFLCTADAQAQQRKGQGGGRGGMGMGGMVGPGIISYPAVQKELKLDDKQAEEARVFAEAYRAKAMEMMADLEGLEGQARASKMQEMTAKHSATGMKEVEKMLKPEQAKRFKQVLFQARGTEGLTDPEVAKELKITSEQSDKVKNLIEGSRAEMREAMQDTNGDRAAGAEAMGKIRKATNAKALALMSPEQTAKYKEMAGEPFELPAMGGRPGGGRGNN